MKSKIFLTVLTALIMAATLVWAPSTALANDACDPDYVMQAGQVISVSPTGVDDTANLQCAFDLAGANNPGIEIHLLAGTFHTGQVVINDFHGTFTGEGMDTTTIANIPNLLVTPVDFYINSPSADNPWPMLFSFVNGDFSVSDLGIIVRGDTPTMGWTIFGIDPPAREIAVAIGVLGTEAHVTVNRVLIEGEPMENSLYGYNLINGVYMEGFMGELPWPPITGSLEIYNSTFRHLGAPVPVLNLVNATVIISHNRMEDIFDASDASDVVNSSIIFTHNQVNDALFGYWLYSGWSGNSKAKILIKNNVFGGTYGPYFDAVFGEGSKCLIMGNNFQNVTDIHIFLGPDVTGCTVIGGNNKINVLNLGTGNILVGVNNMGSGVGSTIQPFMKRYK